MNYTFDQVKFILFNYRTLSEGDFPGSMSSEKLGIRVPQIGRARFEAACLLAAEVGIRVKKCGPDGLVVEAVFMRPNSPIPEEDIAREYHIDDVHRRINRVVGYCEGPDIRTQTYDEWRKENRNKRNLRSNVTGTICAASTPVV